MRSAEQRWPAEPKAETITSSITCSRSAVVSTNMALRPPVSAMKGTIGPLRAASAPVDRPGRVGAAGEGDAVPARDAPTSAAPTVSPSPGQQVQQFGWQPGGVEQAHRLGGDQRRLLGRLGEHGVAGGQRRGDLAGEDGQREVPRADAGEDAAAVQLQRVGLADRPFSVSARRTGARPAARSSGRSRPPRAPRRRRRPGLAGLAHGERDQPVAMRLQRVGHGAQHARRALPPRASQAGCACAAAAKAASICAGLASRSDRFQTDRRDWSPSPRRCRRRRAADDRPPVAARLARQHGMPSSRASAAMLRSTPALLRRSP